MDGAQIHVLSFLGERWGMGSPRFSEEQVVAWNAPIQRNGLISPPFLAQLTAVGKALARPSSSQPDK